jgi:hypothetical protein
MMRSWACGPRPSTAADPTRSRRPTWPAPRNQRPPSARAVDDQVVRCGQEEGRRWAT